MIVAILVTIAIVLVDATKENLREFSRSMNHKMVEVIKSCDTL